MAKRKSLAVFKQLAKEFWIPLVVAIFWCIYNFYGKSAQSFEFHLAINCFGAAFFFISWLLSQYFRVCKQAKVEGDLQSIHQNISSVVQELKDASKDLIGYQTGGESYCYLMNSSLSNDSNIGIETVIHEGKYPLFDVSVRVVDVDEFSAAFDVFSAAFKTQRSYKSIIPGHVFMSQNKWNLGNGSQRKFNIFWTARNGSFTQVLWFKKIDNQWHHATKVVREDVILLEDASEGYPRDMQEHIDW